MRQVRFIVLFLLPFLGVESLGKNAVIDYDSLSRLPSEQLLESGRSYYEQRQGGKALACFSIVGERYKQDRTSNAMELSIRALNNCACVYKYFFSDYIQAYDYFTRAYDLCEQAKYDEFLPVVMVNLADLLNDYGTNYDSQPMAQQALTLFDTCMQRAVEGKNWELMVTAFFNLANQNYQLDLEKYHDMLFSSEIPDSTRDLQYVRLQFRGLQSMQQENFAQARVFFAQQLAVVSARWEPERDTLATYMSIARTYRMESDHEKEAEYLEKALHLASDVHVGDHDIALCNLLAECYSEMGCSDQQKHYRQLYLEKKEEAHANRLVSIGEMNLIHELKKEEEHALELSARHDRQQFFLVAVVFVLLIVLASAFLLWSKNRQLKMRNRSLYEKTLQLQKAEQENQQLMKYNRSNLSDEQKSALIFRIQEILSNSEEICQQDFALTKLAKLVDSNTTYVSQVINEKYGTAFSNVLAACRIREACRRMSDPAQPYGNITIEGIATNTGFKSRTAFVNAFKRETGLTPSDYLRIASVEKTNAK